MQIAIHTSRLDLAPAERLLIRRRAGFALARIAGHVRNVVVSLFDLNGPRGGIDKRCRVVVQLERGPAVVVEDVDSELPDLIDRTMARAGRAAHKRVSLGTLRRRARDWSARLGGRGPSDAADAG